MKKVSRGRGNQGDWCAPKPPRQKERVPQHIQDWNAEVERKKREKLLAKGNPLLDELARQKGVSDGDQSL